VRSKLESELQKQDDEALRYELSYIDCPKQRVPILFEFSEDEDDTEIIALVPNQGFFASGNTKEEAKSNLLSSMEDDYRRLRQQKDSLGKKLWLKLNFLESLF